MKWELQQTPLFSTQSLKPAKWTYVAVVWQPAANGSESSLTLYIDGQSRGGSSSSLSNVISYSATAAALYAQLTISSTIQFTWSIILKALGTLASFLGSLVWCAITANWFSVACMAVSTIAFCLSLLNPITAGVRVAAAMTTLALSIANLLSVVVQPHTPCTQ